MTPQIKYQNMLFVLTVDLIGKISNPAVSYILS